MDRERTWAQFLNSLVLCRGHHSSRPEFEKPELLLVLVVAVLADLYSTLTRSSKALEPYSPALFNPYRTPGEPFSSGEG